MVQKLAKRNHIHTLEYSSRSKLCGLSLNSSEGRDSVADLKTFANNSEEALTHRSVEEHFILVFNPCYGEEARSAPSPTTRVFVGKIYHTTFSRKEGRHFLPD